MQEFKTEISWGAYMIKTISPAGNAFVVAMKPIEYRKAITSRLAILRSSGEIVYHRRDTVGVYMPHAEEEEKDIINCWHLVTWSVDGRFIWFTQLDRCGRPDIILVDIKRVLFYSISEHEVLSWLPSIGVSLEKAENIEEMIKKYRLQLRETPRNTVLTWKDLFWGRWYIRNVGSIERLGKVPSF